MKNFVKYVLQNLLGFENYLYFFSRFCIRKVYSGHYEEEFLHFISLVPNRGIILDIGANIGITAVPLAEKNRLAELHAYEPIAENFKTLDRVVKSFALSNVKLYNYALGNSYGNLKMIMPLQGKTKMQGLSKMCNPCSDEDGLIYDVPVKKLDDIYSGVSNISAIKIDVENFEHEVLQGAKQLLMDNRPIIYCELWDNEKRQLVFDYLISLDYSIHTYNNHKKDLQPLLSPYVSKSSNFFFLYY